MKRHGNDVGSVKKIALALGLLTMLMAAGGAQGQDSQSSKEVRVDSVTPAIFGAGAKIVIKGDGFLAEDTVSLNALKLEDVTVKPTVIKGTIPAKAKNGKKLMIKRGKKKVATFLGFTFAKAPIAKRTKPLFGVPGGEIKLFGNHLEAVDELKINETIIKIDTKEKKSLTFTVPNNLTTGTLTVSGVGGEATLKKPFEVFYPPVISKVAPKAAFPGETVTITGKHFGTKGIAFRIGKKKVKTSQVTDTKAVFSLAKNAKSGIVSAKARKVQTDSKIELTVYPEPKVAVVPKRAASPGTLKVRGKNLDVVEKWTIAGKPLAVDKTFPKASAKQVQLTIPDNLVTEGTLTATYKKREFAAKKSTKIAAAPHISAIRFEASDSGCAYTVIGKNFSQDTAFKLGNKKVKPLSVVKNGAVLNVKGKCAAKYNKVSAKNGKVSGNTFKFNPKAGGYSATITEALAQLASGNATYSPEQIASDLTLMANRFEGSDKTFAAKGKAAKDAKGRAEVDGISQDVGEALIRLTLAKQALCAAMSPGKAAASSNASNGELVDRAVKTEKRIMKNVLHPLWSNLPKSAMAKNTGVHLNVVDDKIVKITAFKKMKNACKGKYYGAKLIAQADKVTAVDLTSLHEKTLLSALNNLALKNKNSVIGEKDLADALYSFSSSRRNFWMKKSKQASSKVQKSGKKKTGKGAGKGKTVKKSTKKKPSTKKPKGKTGKGKK